MRLVCWHNFKETADKTRTTDLLYRKEGVNIKTAETRAFLAKRIQSDPESESTWLQMVARMNDNKLPTITTQYKYNTNTRVLTQTHDKQY